MSIFFDLSPPALVISDFLVCITCFIRDISLPTALVFYVKSQFSLTRSQGFVPLRCSSRSAKNAASFSAFVYLRYSTYFIRLPLIWANSSSAFALRARFYSYSASCLMKSARLRSYYSSSTFAIISYSSYVRSDSGCWNPPSVGAAFWKGSSEEP